MFKSLFLEILTFLHFFFMVLEGGGFGAVIVHKNSTHQENIRLTFFGPYLK